MGKGTRWVIRFGGNAILDERMARVNSIMIRIFLSILRGGSVGSVCSNTALIRVWSDTSRRLI